MTALGQHNGPGECDAGNEAEYTEDERERDVGNDAKPPTRHEPRSEPRCSPSEAHTDRSLSFDSLASEIERSAATWSGSVQPDDCPSMKVALLVTLQHSIERDLRRVAHGRIVAPALVKQVHCDEALPLRASSGVAHQPERYPVPKPSADCFMVDRLDGDTPIIRTLVVLNCDEALWCDS